MRYLVSVTQQIGNYWAKEMGLQRNSYKVITDSDQLRGRRINMSEVVFVGGQPFDWPESVIHTVAQSRKYSKLVVEVESVLRRPGAYDI